MPPPAPTAPPPPKPKSPPAPTNGSNKKFKVSRGIVKTAQRIGIYGPGGIGKTELASMLPDPIFIDLDEGSLELNVARLSDASGVNLIETWADLIACLRDETNWTGCKSIVIDTATTAEEMAIAHTLKTVKTDRGELVSSIEGYGYGKGFTYVFDTFLGLFTELDRHVRAGRHVAIISHDCTNQVPNPAGEDWIRYEPLLQTTKKGNASIRYKFRDWCDHLFFIGYDVYATDGKGVGSGTRTIYPVEMPTHLAKSRRLAQPIPYVKNDSTLWTQLFEGA